MSVQQRNLATSLASLLLEGNVDGFQNLAQEADGPVIGRAIDLFHVMRRRR